MLAKKHRLSGKDIKSFIRLSKNFHTDNFYGKFCVNEFKKPKFAVIIPINIIKKSTGRHLLKRRIIYILLKFIKKDPKILKKSFSLIIFSKKQPPTLNFNQISIEINKILEHVSKNF